MPAPLPVGRLAPSPTGLLHLGHARSFLFAWWSIRSRGGRIVLRIEDLDAERCKPGLADACLRDLEWLGLDWDGEVTWQSAHAVELSAAAHELHARGLAYPCTCTRKEIERARSAPHPGEDGPAYPGTCRGRYSSLEEAEAHGGRRGALRFQVPAGPVAIEDVLHGRYEQDVSRAVGDFPITGRDGQVAYQLAVVLDDARQGVTEVLRGDDLLSSTPRQALLQDALALPRPVWIHVPLVTDAAGRRLAKRSDDLALSLLRESGASPESLVAWAARSAGVPVAGPCRASDLIGLFDLERLPRAPVSLGGAALRALGFSA